MAWLYIILAVIVIALVIVIANLKIVPQSKAYVIERLGAYPVSYTHLTVHILRRGRPDFTLKFRSLRE